MSLLAAAGARHIDNIVVTHQAGWQADGAQVRVFNERGEYHCAARVSERARPGVVHGLGIWLRKFGLRGIQIGLRKGAAADERPDERIEHGIDGGGDGERSTALRARASAIASGLARSTKLGFDGTMGFFTQKLGLPWIIAFLVIMGEFFGSLGLLSGFLTRFSAGSLIVIMLGAITMAHLPHGFFMNWFGQQQGEGVVEQQVGVLRVGELGCEGDVVDAQVVVVGLDGGEGLLEDGIRPGIGLGKLMLALFPL